MKKTWILVFLVNILFFSCVKAQASLTINEIMYDLEGSDEGKEWVEVYNSGSEIIDLSTYKFFEGDTNHKLILSEGSAKIEAQGYAVIISDPVKFKSSLPNFLGNIFDSSFSLSNAGETLAIKDKDLNTDDEIIYSVSMGASGNGRTISKIDGVWKEGRPTPGAVNQIYLPPPKTTPSPASAPKKEINILTEKVATQVTPEETLEEIPLNQVNNDVKKESVNLPILITALIFIIGLGTSATYFIRRKGIVAKAGDDFNILDE